MRVELRLAASLVLMAGTCSIAMAEDGPVVMVTGRAPTMEHMTIFVGEKLLVEQVHPALEPGEIMLDSMFQARYRVRQVVQGDDPGDVIEFTVYDHYGRPRFERYPHVLLFVNRSDDRYYHAKYQYYPVFLTRNGAWAACAPSDEYDAEQRDGIAAAKPMAFGSDAYLPVDTELSAAENRRIYPPRHFRIEGDRAYCLTGNTLSELIKIKQRTVFNEAARSGEDSGAGSDRPFDED